MTRGLSVGHRIAITVIIVLAVLLAFAAYGYFTGAWEADENNAHIYDLASAESAQAQPQTCFGPEEREYLRALTIKAIDQAYEDQIIRLFEVWMKDSHEQPRRAINGTQIAISAHARARNNAYNWNPPLCAVKEQQK
jgi:hypothetical protein